MVKRKKEKALLDYYESEMRLSDEVPFMVGLVIWLVCFLLVLRYLRED